MGKGNPKNGGIEMWGMIPLYGLVDTEHPADPITVGKERKIWFCTPPRSPENAIPKPRKL